MHDLIASPYMSKYMLVRPGHVNGIALPQRHYDELAEDPGEPAPGWLRTLAAQAWPDLELADRPRRETILIRHPSPYAYARASWEVDLGCNWGCDFCYLGEKRFSSLTMPDRERILDVFAAAGVLFLQLTGGEILLDKLLAQTYTAAHERGMMLALSTNGSRLHDPRILDLLTTLPPYRITVSVYGASAETYDTVVRRRGGFAQFVKGLQAAKEAGLRLSLNVVTVAENEHELAEMTALAAEYGERHHVYTSMSPTIDSEAGPLASQSLGNVRKRSPFKGCNAGQTFFHVDPAGLASICKVGRDEQIDLLAEGVEGLVRLPAIGDGLMLRTGGCSGCALSGSCMVCRPLAKLYQEAKSPLAYYCQHGQHPDTEGR